MDKVLLFGRTNVGKSTLFNKLSGENRAIVEQEPGVTRDINMKELDWTGKKFILLDSGGMEFEESDYFSKTIIKMNNEIISEAKLILFVVDFKMGLTAHDKELANYIRKRHDNIVVVINRNDNMEDTWEFHELGFDRYISVSAIHGRNSGDLLDIIVDNIECEPVRDNEEETRRVIIVGKPNVGKSSLFNRISSKERAMVTPVAGTTRDFVEEAVEFDGNHYVFVDTAGLRRKRSIHKKVEKHSVYRTVKAIDKSDLAILMLDAQEPVSTQDTKIAGLIEDAGKAIIILVNKWDAVTENRDVILKDKVQEIREKLHFVSYAPVLSISALTGQRVNKVYNMIEEVFQIYYRTIPDRVLNNNFLPVIKMKLPEIKFIKQVKKGPPHFLIFTSKKLHFSKKRFIENVFRENIEFSGTPVRMIFREP